MIKNIIRICLIIVLVRFCYSSTILIKQINKINNKLDNKINCFDLILLNFIEHMYFIYKSITHYFKFISIE
jgi:hypothetical protein